MSSAIKTATKTDFQALATAQGREFVEECVVALTRAGFAIIGREIAFPRCGVDVDLLARNSAGVDFHIECKGSFRDRPGLQRTDTLKKAICNMLLLMADGRGPLLILTSHRPADGRGVTMLRAAQAIIPFEVIVPRDDWKRLTRLAVATPTDLAGASWNFSKRLL